MVPLKQDIDLSSFESEMYLKIVFSINRNTKVYEIL